MYLDGEEYGWFLRFLEVRERGIPRNPYFFSCLGRGEAKSLVKYVRVAWAEMGLSGVPTLTDFRTAVSTYVSIAHTPPYRRVGR